MSPVGVRGRRLVVRYPWTFTIGLARSGIALATLATLAATPTSSLFRPLRGPFDAPSCEGVQAIGLFCLSGSGGRELVKWAAAGILLVVASGWRPRLTALPHWWVTFSVFHGIATPDGGDQIASVVAAVLIPYCLADPRRWQWSGPVRSVAGWRVVLAASAIAAIKVQMSFLYFQASVAKLPHPEWGDGTAIYYFLNAPHYGAASWWHGLLGVVLSSGAMVALLTWVPLAIELALAVTLLTRGPARLWLFGLGTAFHGTIALTMGLWTFSTIMVCCLLIFTVPIGSELRWDGKRWVDRLRQRRRAGENCPGGHLAPSVPGARRTRVNHHTEGIIR